MDTVEWGTATPARRARPTDPYRWISGLGVERPAAAALAGLGVLALIVAQVVPWGTMGPEGSDTRVTMYLDGLPAVAVIAFDLGLIPLLALTAAALAARPAARRTFAFAGIGTAAGLAVMLAGIIRVVLSPDAGDARGIDTLDLNTSLALGPYAAVVALSLLTGSLLFSALPPRGAPSVAPPAPDWGRPRWRPRPGQEPEPPEQPLDLTVTAVPPVNQRLLGG